MRTSTATLQVRLPEPFAFADLTDDLRKAIKDSGVTDGSAIAFCAHTTCTLLINESEDGAFHDLTARLEALVPRDTYYAHDDLTRRTQNIEDPHERQNGHAHVSQMLLGGSSHAIPVLAGEPALGRWQRLLLLELDEPRERNVLIHVFGE